MNKPLIAITGASSGIGAAMAKIFSAAGYPLCLLARNQDALDNLKIPNSTSFAVDVTHFHHFKEAILKAEHQFGPVDLLCNNAGFVKSGDFIEVGQPVNDDTVNTNLKGVIHGIEIVLPGMRERKRGTIINTSSIADRNARPNLAVYAATKAAVKSLSESLRMANAPFGIRICNITPAKINTPMMIAAHFSQNDAVDPTIVAKTVLWMYELPQTVCIRDLVIAPTAYEP